MAFDLENPGLAIPNQPAATRPLVDVILITYNHEKFVKDAIESVLAQRTEFEYRVIIGDDCSTDNTQAIIRSYAEKYPERFHLLLDSEHRGLNHRDRVGIRTLGIATAKYVALLDGDDYWTDSNKLQKQVAFLESHPEFAICCHNARMSYDDGPREAANLIPADQKEVSNLEDLLFANFIPTCSVVFRRGLFGELPEWFFTLSIADWPLHILNAQHGKIEYFNEVMATYRVHQGGAWSSRSGVNKALSIIKMLEHVNAHLSFRYQRKIRATQAEWYYQAAEMTYRVGDANACRKFLSKYLLLDRLRGGRRALSIFLRVRCPGVYSYLRSARDLLPRVTETGA